MMFRSLTLYAVIGAGRHSKPLRPVKSDHATMLAIASHHNLPHWLHTCSRHRIETSQHQTAVSQSFTGLSGALVSLKVRCIGTVAGTPTPLLDSGSSVHGLGVISQADESASIPAQQPASTNSNSVSQVAAEGSQPVAPGSETNAVAAAKQLLHTLRAASQRNDHAAVKRLFDPAIAWQKDVPTALAIYKCMLMAHAAWGEGPQAVALLKEMRAKKVPVYNGWTPAYNALVQAFCKADALQDALLHLQCTVPPQLVNTHMINCVLIAAAQSKQPHPLVLQQCLDILQEHDLRRNATTWRQIFRLRAKASDLDGIAHSKAELDGSVFSKDTEVHTAYVRALCFCNQLEQGNQAMHHMLRLISPSSRLPASAMAQASRAHDSLLAPKSMAADPIPAITTKPALGIDSQQTPSSQQTTSSQHATPSQLTPPSLETTPSEQRTPAQASIRQPSASPTDRTGWRNWVSAALNSDRPHDSLSSVSSSSTHEQTPLSPAQPSPSHPTSLDSLSDTKPGAQQPLDLDAMPSQQSTHDQQLDFATEPISRQQSVSAQSPSEEAHSLEPEQQQPSLSQQAVPVQAMGQAEGLQQAGGLPKKPDDSDQDLQLRPTADQGKPTVAKGKAPVAKGLSKFTSQHVRDACHMVMTLAERRGQFDIVLSLLDSMHQASVALDTALQNSVMRMALHQGRTPAQLEAYLLRLRGMGLKPDAQTFNVLLRAYAARGDLQAATETLERMGAEGVIAGRYTFNALLEAYAAAGDVDGAANVYETMKDRGVKADQCTFIPLFMAIKNQYVAAHYHDESGGAKETDRHQRLTKRSKSSELLHEWVADMKAAGLKHIGPSLTALVQAYGHTMDFTRMVHLLRASWSAPNSAKPNLLTYNAAIAACCRVGHLGRALRLLNEMRASGIAPDVYTYTSLISGCGFSRQLRTAKQLWSEMSKQGIKPTRYTYNARAKVESSVGAFDDALRTTQQMQTEGVKPDKVTWQVILSKAEEMKRPDVIEQVHLQAGMIKHSTEAATSAPRLIQPCLESQTNSPILRESEDSEAISADDLEDGGWSSGFDDSDDDDIIGGPL